VECEGGGGVWGETGEGWEGVAVTVKSQLE